MAVLGIVLLVLGAIYIRNPHPVAGGMSQGIGEFFTSVVNGMVEVAKIGHVWIASIIGRCAVRRHARAWRRLDAEAAHGAWTRAQSAAGFGSSMLWLGLAAGSAVIPWWSDHIKGRKLPIILGGAVQLACSSRICSTFRTSEPRLQSSSASSSALPTPTTCLRSAPRRMW